MVSLSPLFYVLRHGATPWNAENRLMGQQDIALSSAGIDRVKRTADLVLKLKIGTILTSPLSRAYETAQLVAGTVEVKIVNDLQEANFGEWEGEQKSVPMLNEWRQGKITPTGGESYGDFRKRIQNVLRDGAAEKGPLLYITHGSVLDLLIEICGVDRRVLDHASTKGRVIRFQRGEFGWTVGYV